MYRRIAKNSWYPYHNLSYTNCFIYFWSTVPGQIVLACAHLAAGVYIVYTSKDREEGEIDIFMTFVADSGGDSLNSINLESYFVLNLYYVDGAFLLFTALSHALYSNAKYSDNYNMSSLQMRWFEYSISSPVMFALIAILSGVRDIYQLVLLMGLMMVTMMFGQFVDKGMDVFWYGCVPYIIAWVIVFIIFYDTVHDRDPPPFVYGVVIVMFFLYSLFPIVQWRYKYSSYGIGLLSNTSYSFALYDGAMHFLSLASKMVLAFWTYFGIRSTVG